jgi:RNA recognition motif-containing protein
VTSAKVIMNKFSGKSKGFGFVDMPDDTAAKKAITELNNTNVDGRSVKVTEARPREDGSSGYND